MPNAQEFGDSFLKFMQTMNASAPRREAFFAGRLGAHFGRAAAELPIVEHKFPLFDQPNLQLSLDELCAAEKDAGRTPETIGVSSEHRQYSTPDLASLATTETDHFRSAKPGPVEYSTFQLADGEALSCIQCGLLLVRPGDVPLAVMVNGPTRNSYEREVSVSVMAPTREQAESFLAGLRSRVHRLSVYRGHVLSVEWNRGMELHFHRLPVTTRESIILPGATLQRIERQTISFATQASALRSAGRHLKRGVLLHGPPGTGKTLTAMYLATQMQGRTVVLVTGRGHGLIEQVCWLARALQPATVILEDVDLIATDREDSSRCTSPLLFELLNQMDGLAEDADILFILTTNRPEALEPALAARPGRIDQAIEVALPDAECRRRLIDLYSRGIELRISDPASLVSRTKGASGAFIKELLRRATLLACIDGAGSVVDDRHVDESLRELVLTGALTRRILGFTGSESGADGA